MPIAAATLHAADLDLYRFQSLLVVSTPVGEVLDSRGLCLVNTGGPFAAFNLAFFKPPLDDFEATIARAEAYFGAKDFPFRFGVQDEHREVVAERLLGAGYSEAPPVPSLLFCDPPAAPKPPPELSVVEIGPGKLADEFRGVAERSFGFPTGMGAVAISDRVVEHPDTALFLGRVDGAPVATSILHMSNRIGGIYFVGCEEAYRGRGYGEAITWACVSAGVQRGATAASLQASDLGRPVYERMGFDVTGYYHYFVSPGADTSFGF